MGFEKEDKELVCLQCALFFDSNDFDNCKCPQCESDVTVFVNDLNEED